MTARQTKILGESASFIVKLVVGIIFVIPLIIGLCFSFQLDSELATYPLKLISSNPTIDNYANVFAKVPLLLYLRNSVIVCGIAILGQILFASFASYAFVYLNFPFKKQIYTLVLLTMMIPGEVVVITNYVSIQNMGLINTFAALVLPSLVSGTAIFMMRQYYMTIPKDFKEAATLDGCGDMRFLFRIAMPLSVPTITSLCIYLFVQIYNQYFWPLLVTNKDTMRTVQIGISFLITSDIISYGNILAGAVIAITPSVIIYIFGQDYIIKGMTAGGIKG